MWIYDDKLIATSVTYSNGSYSSMNIYSLANPKKPALLRSLKQDYPFITSAHDTYGRNDTLFVSAAYQGLHLFRYDIFFNTFSHLGSLTSYSTSGYNHSSALTPDGKTLVFMDEVPHGLPIKVADVTNPSNIQVLAYTNQYTLTTPHNPFMVNNQYCFVSSYQDGLQLYDISNPSAPVLAGYFDTYYQAGGNTGTYDPGYHGNWGCYPYFPSKNIFALDMKNGVFMLNTHLYSNQNPVSVKETLSNNFQMSLYPNPVHHTLHFNVPSGLINKDYEVQVTDMTGRLVTKKESSQLNNLGSYNQEIELSGLESGLYILKLISERQTVSSKKFIFDDDYAR